MDGCGPAGICTATLLDESAQPTLALHGKRIPLTADRSDPHHVIYSSENGDYQVDVWRADASPMEVSQEDFDALTAASLASISTQEQVPSHEMYGTRSNAGVVTIGQYYRKAMICLNVTCGSYSIRKSVS